MGKSIFTVNLLLKLFRATVDNADIGSLKSLHTFLKKYLYHMLVKFEQIVWSKLHEILSFLTENGFFYHRFWQRVDAILEDVPVVEIIFQC